MLRAFSNILVLTWFCSASAVAQPTAVPPGEPTFGNWTEMTFTSDFSESLGQVQVIAATAGGDTLTRLTANFGANSYDIPLDQLADLKEPDLRSLDVFFDTASNDSVVYAYLIFEFGAPKEEKLPDGTPVLVADYVEFRLNKDGTISRNVVSSGP